MEILIVSIAVIPILWFILQSIYEYIRTDTATKYLMYGDPLKKRHFLTTLLASNSGLSGAIYLIAVYGWVSGAGTAFWAILFFLLTMGAAYLVLKRIGKLYPDFLQSRGTLHEFLGKAFGSPTIRLLAGTASLFAYIGLVACEIVLAQKIVGALFLAGGLPESWAVAGRIGLATLVIAYTFAAGFRAGRRRAES